MNDLTPRTRQEVQKAGMLGIGAGVGGIGLLALSALSGNFFLGLVVGGVVTLGGFAVLGGKEASDKKAGAVVTAAGLITVANALFHSVPLLKGLTGLGAGIMWIAGLGLLGVGIWNFIKFVKGLKSRA